jgi:outer membrane protein
VSTRSALLPRGLRAAAPARRAAAVVLLLTLAAAAWQPAHAGDAAAAGVGLEALLAAVAQHPGLRAADAAADAAALRADAVRSPVSLRLDLESQRLRVEDASTPLPPPFDDLFAIDDATDRATVTAILRPFVAGELRDLLDQRVLDLERAELTLRETRAALEAQAVRAAAGVLLAERGVALAVDARDLGDRALAATRTRHASGAASDLDLRRAELQLADAERGVARAERQLAAAEAALRQLAGPARITDLPDLTPVLGAPPDLVRAALDLALADVGARNQGRALLPTVQAGYTWLGDDGDRVTVGLESRSWQPSLTYATGSGGQAAGVGGMGGGIGGGDALEGLTPSVRGSLTVGVSWTISPQASLERDASRRQVDAAVAALEAAHDRAALQRRADADALADARAAVLQAELERSLAIEEAAAAALRFDAGLIGALERDQAHLALTQAELGWWASRVDALGAVLDTYVAYAIPLSEVLP